MGRIGAQITVQFLLAVDGGRGSRSEGFIAQRSLNEIILRNIEWIARAAERAACFCLEV